LQYAIDGTNVRRKSHSLAVAEWLASLALPPDYGARLSRQGVETVADLAVLSQSEWMQLTGATFPGHTLRIQAALKGRDDTVASMQPLDHDALTELLVEYWAIHRQSSERSVLALTSP
jgi:hypothetical protein